MSEEVLVGDSKERVAFELMLRIAGEDIKGGQVRKEGQASTYYPALYRMCLGAVYGRTLEEIEIDRKARLRVTND